MRSNLVSKVLRISSIFIWKSNEQSSYAELRRIITSAGELSGCLDESKTTFETSGTRLEASGRGLDDSGRSFFYSEGSGG